MDKESYIDKAIIWANKKSFSSLRARKEGYEEPKVFTNQSTQEQIQADLSFIARDGEKYFTEIALKTDDPQPLVTKWKLLSLMAEMKNGKLFLLTPKGHKVFTQRLIKEYKIDAEIFSI
jgi:hypothetical protein